MTAIVSQPSATVLPAWQRISTLLAACVFGLIAAGLLLFGAQARPTLAPPPPEVPLNQLQVDVYLPDTLRAGSVLTHQLRYTNTLGVALNNVVLTDSLSYKQYYSGTYTSNPVIPRSAFTYTGNFNSGYTLRWNIGTLAANANGTIVLTSTVPPARRPTCTTGRRRWAMRRLSHHQSRRERRRRQRVGDDCRPRAALRQDRRRNSRGPARAALYRDDRQPVDRSAPDSIAATNLVITDPVPAYTTFLSASQGGVYSPTLNAVTWRWPGPLNPGGNYAVTMAVRLSETLPVNYPIVNVNYCASADEIVGAVPCGLSVINPVGSSFDKTAVTGPPPGVQHVWPKELVTYTIKLWNPHAVPVTVRLTDTLPGNPLPFQFRYMVRGPTPVITTRCWCGTPCRAGAHRSAAGVRRARARPDDHHQRRRHALLQCVVRSRQHRLRLPAAQRPGRDRGGPARAPR
jgi:hypothetical protein